MRIAFIGYQRQEKYEVASMPNEDDLLLAYLKDQGLSIEPVVWNDTAVDWAAYDVAVLKSPWDYHEQIAAFGAWLTHLDESGVKLLNPANTLRWNCDKHYLREIADDGLPVIASAFLERGQGVELLPLFEQFSTDRLVVKPCISAGAKNTIMIDRENAERLKPEVDALLAQESLIVQPFIPQVQEGEWSFIFFGGVYSHHVLKLPRSGDFRVQHYLGGTIHTPPANPAHIAAAYEYTASYAKNCLYARVDGVIIDDVFHLMELELIEPFLFLETSAGAYARYHQALMQHLA